MSQEPAFKEDTNFKSASTLSSLSDVHLAAKRIGPNRYFCVPSFDAFHYK
jgi:hypothetical protein